jgi:hypothetical protein
MLLPIKVVPLSRAVFHAGRCLVLPKAPAKPKTVNGSRLADAQSPVLMKTKMKDGGWKIEEDASPHSSILYSPSSILAF